MASNARFAEVASLAGDPARAAMLHALMDGRALTATELAHAASVTPQTASGHLARMATAGLLGLEKQGRHRYFRLASPAVAQMMESIMQVASVSDAAARPVVVGPRDAALRAARTCYDHLAGRLAVERWSRTAVLNSPATALSSPTRALRFSIASASTWARSRPGATGAQRASCAVRVSIGASGARTSAAASAQRYARTASPTIGSAACLAPARSP